MRRYARVEGGAWVAWGRRLRLGVRRSVAVAVPVRVPVQCLPMVSWQGIDLAGVWLTRVWLTRVWLAGVWRIIQHSFATVA